MSFPATKESNSPLLTLPNKLLLAVAWNLESFFCHFLMATFCLLTATSPWLRYSGVTSPHHAGLLAHPQKCDNTTKKANASTERDTIAHKASKRKNYSTRDSHVVTHHSTNIAIHCLTRAERTGSRAFSVL
jgi:hypothetical protein